MWNITGNIDDEGAVVLPWIWEKSETDFELRSQGFDLVSVGGKNMRLVVAQQGCLWKALGVL